MTNIGGWAYVSKLHSTQEEADTLMILHGVDAAREGYPVDIYIPRIQMFSS